MRVAILGMGFMGEKHKKTLSLFPSVKIVGLIDPKNNTNYPYFYSLEDFLSQKPSADLVVISTPNYLHHKNAILLLKNGYNVLIEKPFCFNITELNEIKNLAIKNNKKAFIVLQNRFSNLNLLLEKSIKENLGKIYNIQCNAFWNRDERYYTKDSWKGKKTMDGGILYTQFSHLIDLIINFLGEEITIKYNELSSKRNHQICEIEDSFVAILESNKGTSIVLNFTNAVYKINQETSLNIIAEKGTIKIAGQYFDEIIYQNINGIDEDFPLKKNSNENNLYQLYEEIFKNLNHQENKAILIEQGEKLISLLSEFYQ